MSKTKASILIVDDEEPIRRILSRKLEAEGYTCVTATDAEEALESISTGDFDLVLLDIRMPGPSGIEVLRYIRSTFPDVPVVIVTAVPGNETAFEAKELGACDYLTKPFHMNDLTMKVERAIETRRLMSAKGEVASPIET